MRVPWPHLGDDTFLGVPPIHSPSKILNRLSKTMYSAASPKKRKDSLPPLAYTQQVFGEKESFAWTGNFL